jgi:hypothetical protein
MRTNLLLVAGSLSLAVVPVRADNANYEATVSAQAPAYEFTFDNTLSSVGSTATFTASGTAGFGSDYSGNVNAAVSYSALTDYLSLASPAVISGAGTSTAVGSLSMLFYMPSTVPSTGYLFSDDDATSGDYFALGMSGGVFDLKLKNKTFALPTPTANTWYYIGLTYNLNGTATGVNGVNWYLAAAGGSLATGFIQNGGTGNMTAADPLGDGNPFVLGNRRAENNAVVGGEIDELATWTTALSPAQITGQFDALTVTETPEPCVGAMLGLGGLLLMGTRRFLRA